MPQPLCQPVGRLGRQTTDGQRHGSQDPRRSFVAGRACPAPLPLPRGLCHPHSFSTGKRNHVLLHAWCVVWDPKKQKKKKTVQFIRVTEKQAVCAFGIVGGRLDGRGRPARHSCSGGVAPITARRPCLASVHPSLELSSMNDELISKPRRGRGGVSIGWGRGRGRASLLLLLPAGERRRHAPRSTRCCTSREGRAARLLVLADGGGRRRRRQLRSLSSISHPRPG
jgi:hypothetical protein